MVHSTLFLQMPEIDCRIPVTKMAKGSRREGCAAASERNWDGMKPLQKDSASDLTKRSECDRMGFRLGWKSIRAEARLPRSGHPGEGWPNSRPRGNYQFNRSAACSWRGVLKISLLEVSVPKVALCRVVEPVPNRTRLKMLNPSMRKSRFTFSVIRILRFRETFSLKLGNWRQAPL